MNTTVIKFTKSINLDKILAKAACTKTVPKHDLPELDPESGISLILTKAGNSSV